MKENYKKFPLPKGKEWFRLPERLKALEEKLAQAAFELPYKVFTALITQEGGDAPAIRFGDGEIAEGVSYYIAENPDNENLTLVGAPSNNPGTFFTATKTVNGGYSPSVRLEYNEGAPTAIVLENTLGGVAFGYINTGRYSVNSNGLFKMDKTTISIDAFGQDGNSSGLAVIGNTTLNNEDKFEIISAKGGESDGILQKTRIEIKVYK